MSHISLVNTAEIIAQAELGFWTWHPEHVHLVLSAGLVTTSLAPFMNSFKLSSWLPLQSSAGPAVARSVPFACLPRLQAMGRRLSDATLTRNGCFLDLSFVSLTSWLWLSSRGGISAFHSADAMEHHLEAYRPDQGHLVRHARLNQARGG